MLTHHTIDDFAAMTVNTGLLTLTLIPALGGKVSSLVDLRSGREWLWRHPRLPYAQVPADADYGAQADTGGWDECFPSVARCAYPAAPWQGVAIADHGELWSQEAAVTVTETTDQIALHCVWHGVALPYRFERTLRLQRGSATLHAAYAVTNLGAAPLRFIWCAHPLLAIEPGMRLELPEQAIMQRWAALPDTLVPADVPLRLPLTAIDLSNLPKANGTALKLWSDPLPPDAGTAALHAANGALQMRWDTALLPQIAFWLNLGAAAGDGGAPLYNLGLEPCIGAQDSLEQAITVHDLAAELPPAATQHWWLELELSVPGDGVTG
jgi:galactose mutarotase-like enzyme